MSDYQKLVKRGHARKKKKLIGTGGYKKLKYGAKRPSYKRARSAPPGFGVFEEGLDLKVATFDFDETLAIWSYDDYEKQSAYPNLQTFLQLIKLKSAGYDIHVVTSRHSSRSKPVYNFIQNEEIILYPKTDKEKRIKISDLIDKENVHFAGGDKAHILKDLNSEIHFDDKAEEFELYSKLYPDDQMKFYHIKFDVDWDDYYNGLLPNQTLIQSFGHKSEVKHESTKSSNKNYRQMRKRN
jgi:hydroxymethylpyrimidine pyrophosphatase-like HAD family hydrolase